MVVNLGRANNMNRKLKTLAYVILIPATLALLVITCSASAVWGS
jgi:hypothetical protein